MKTFLSLVLGAVFGATSVGVALGLYSRIHPAPPPAPIPVVAIPDALTRFSDALAAGDRVCGPVPFEIRVGPDSISFTCGRPVPVVKTKIPGPKIAEATP